MENLIEKLVKTKSLKAIAAVSPRVHALRGLVRLPEDFDEREFKSERLASRFGV